MIRKAISVIAITLMLTGVALTFNIHPAAASGTVYIRADGSIDPSTASISSLDSITYTFTNSIYDTIVVERSNIIINGNGHILHGQDAYESKGITLSGRSNVTIKNIEIRAFYFGIRISNSTDNSVVRSKITKNEYGISLLKSAYSNFAGNNITSNLDGISIYDSSCISITENNITANERDGMNLAATSSSSIIGNKIAANGEGIYSIFSPSNHIAGNIIENNGCGIYLGFASNNTITQNNIIGNTWPGIYAKYASNNRLWHNNFINTGLQVYSDNSVNTWDDSFPSGGNYWSDFTSRYPSAQELDNSGIWNTPYSIDENNQDNYPLVEPWAAPSTIPKTLGELKTKIIELGSEGEIVNQGIVNSLISKLDAAQKFVDKGKIEAAKALLKNSFISQVQGLSGNRIMAEAGDILIESAQYIISHL